jgi:2-amino-4-hydroxy-6-hydroxymethyldihydropteridine diphosphokinase
LEQVGTVERHSRLYRTKPWGNLAQPDFVNAVVALRTRFEPVALMYELQALERRLGRRPGERWGPRVIDFDVLTYDDVESQGELHLPHPHMHERAFVLVPLAEIDPVYAAARDELDEVELAGVQAIGPRTAPRVSSTTGGSLMPMPQDAYGADRIRRLAEFLAASDAISLRIERGDGHVELGRSPRYAAPATTPVPAASVDTIRADLVGIFRLARPAPVAGESFSADRELAHIEALGIRNPVHSLGGGRIVSIAAGDGSPVEYGQPLFLLDRG